MAGALASSPNAASLAPTMQESRVPQIADPQPEAIAIPPGAESIRLVIWDLDDTFWHGTLAEGGMAYRQDLHDAVITLARRGIISSICSKNDAARVQAELQARLIWDYFVFSSIDWTAKGPRLAALIEAAQLRPETVLFIDDNPHNLAEARHFVPGLQIAGPEILPDLLADPRLRGKDDSGLTRLAQYRVLAQRRADGMKFAGGGNGEEFLRASGITVEFDYDLETHADRVIELINRTNQLNFTKQRLPEDPIGARAALRALFANKMVQGGLLRVRDKYGDYGYAGLFILRHNRAVKELVHFCFSCRILNMGVELWLYQRLGRPSIDIVGPVLSDLAADGAGIDWISVAGIATPAVQTSGRPPVDDVYINGACQMRPMAHFFATVAERVHERFDIIRHDRTMPLQHSLFGYYAATGVPAAARDAFAALGYVQDDFAPFIAAAPPDRRGLWVLNFWTDVAANIYQHNATGALIPVFYNHIVAHKMRALMGPAAHNICNWDSATAGDTTGMIDVLKAEFTHVGQLPNSVLERNVATIVQLAPPRTRVVVLMANQRALLPDGQLQPAPLGIRVNNVVRSALRAHPNVRMLNVADLITAPDDTTPNAVFNLPRPLQYKIFTEIMRTDNYPTQRVAAVQAVR
jgi:FkbH-like protein